MLLYSLVTNFLEKVFIVKFEKVEVKNSPFFKECLQSQNFGRTRKSFQLFLI